MNGGILCGHDCEGRISDYDMDFLQAGKDLDYYETVHCGVVLAVGSIFQKYSINYSMWSVRAKGQNEWEPTNLIPLESRIKGRPLLLFSVLQKTTLCGVMAS